MFLVTSIASQLYTAEVDSHPLPGQRYELLLKQQRKSGKSLHDSKLFPLFQLLTFHISPSPPLGISINIVDRNAGV